MVNVSDINIIIASAIASVGIIVMQVVTAILSHRREMAKIIRDLNVADKVEEVVIKQDQLAESTARNKDKLNTIAKTGNATLCLTANVLTEQLRTTAQALRKVANLTNDPSDEAAALAAEMHLQQHEATPTKKIG